MLRVPKKVFKLQSMLRCVGCLRIQAPTIPPIGTSSCAPVQVLNPRTNQYEWRRVCQ
jgi:hypothetical protein